MQLRYLWCAELHACSHIATRQGHLKRRKFLVVVFAVVLQFVVVACSFLFFVCVFYSFYIFVFVLHVCCCVSVFFVLL